MIKLDNLKPAWKHYKYISGNYAHVNEEDILDMLSQEEIYATLPSSRLLMNFCISLLMIICCTGC